MTDSLWFLAGVLCGVPVLYGMFLVGRAWKRRRDVYRDLWRRVAELARFKADIERLAEGLELDQLGRQPFSVAPGITAARGDAKKTAQAFIARYSGSVKP